MIRLHSFRHQTAEALPTVGYRRGVHLVDSEEDALPELIERIDADVSQEGPRHPREGDLHQIQPRAVLRDVHILEAVRTSGQVARGLPRSVGGVVVQHEADGGTLRIVRVKAPEQRDELPAAVPLLDVRDELPGVQVERGQHRQGTVADIFALAGVSLAAWLTGLPR